MVDDVGCFLPENEKYVARPNARRFIQKTRKHP